MKTQSDSQIEQMKNRMKNMEQEFENLNDDRVSLQNAADEMKTEVLSARKEKEAANRKYHKEVYLNPFTPTDHFSVILNNQWKSPTKLLSDERVKETILYKSIIVLCVQVYEQLNGSSIEKSGVLKYLTKLSMIC